MTEEEKNLNLLALFHYILAGITALFSCFGLIHAAIGLGMVLGRINGSNPPPQAFGWLFLIFGGFFVLLGWILAVAIFIAGRKLKKRTSRTYCFVVASIECAMMPLGTVLGVFTIVLLMKDSVKALFGPQTLDVNL